MITAQKTFTDCPDQSTVELQVIPDTSGGGSVVALCLQRINAVAVPPPVNILANVYSQVVTSPNRYRFNVAINFPTTSATASLLVYIKDQTGALIEAFAKHVASDQDANARISIIVLTALPPAPQVAGGVQ